MPKIRENSLNFLTMDNEEPIVPLRILDFFELPSELASEIFKYSEAFTELNAMIEDEFDKIRPPNSKNAECFKFEFRVICHLARYVKFHTSRPDRQKLKKRYENKKKKILKKLQELNNILRDGDRMENHFIEQIIQHQMDELAKTHKAHTIENCLPRCFALSSRIVEALEHGDSDAERFLQKYHGGYSREKNTQAAINALASSYSRLFDARPTSSVNSAFMQYAAILRWYVRDTAELSVYDEALICDEALMKIVLKAIKKISE